MVATEPLAGDGVADDQDEQSSNHVPLEPKATKQVLEAQVDDVRYEDEANEKEEHSIVDQRKEDADGGMSGVSVEESLDYDAPIDRKRYPAGTLQSSRSKEYERVIALNAWDTDAWTSLVAEAQRRPLSEAHAVYERALHRFPTSGKFWKIYLDHLIRDGRYTEAERLFAYALPQSYSIELCRAYLEYVQDVKHVAPTTVIDAYEYCTRLMKYEMSSHHLWGDYISMLKRMSVQSAVDDAQRTRWIRSAFQRAVCLPLHNLDNIWRSFESFESTLGGGSSSVAVQQFHGAYIRARAEARSRKNRREKIQVTALAVPPRRGTPIMEQAKHWANYIRAEASNLQDLDDSELDERVIFAHEQRLVCMYRMPDAWMDYASYMARRCVSSTCRALSDSIQIMVRANRALPDCLLISFSLARLYEELDLEGARIAGQQEKKREWLREEFDRKSGGKPFDEHDGDENEPRAQTKSQETVHRVHESHETEKSNVVTLNHLSEEASRAVQVYESILERKSLDASRRIHTYIEYMHFVRRTRGILAAREMFKRARHDELCADADALHNLYIAASYIELYANKDENVAKRIFELGLRHIPESSDMALAYVDFLWQRNDTTNLRALFGRLLQSSLPEEGCALVLDRWLSFEAQHSSAGLAGLLSVQAQRDHLFSLRRPTFLLDMLSTTSFLQWVPLNSHEMSAAIENATDEKSTPSESFEGVVPGGIIPSGAMTYNLGHLDSRSPSRLVSRKRDRVGDTTPNDGMSSAAAPSAEGVTTGADSSIPDHVSLEDGLARLVGNLSASVMQWPAPNPDLILRALLRMPSRWNDMPIVTGGREDKNSAQRGISLSASSKERTSSTSLDASNYQPGRGNAIMARSVLSQRLARARIATRRPSSALSRDTEIGHGNDSDQPSHRLGSTWPPPMRDVYRSRHRRQT